MVIGFYSDDSSDHPNQPQPLQTAGAIFGWPVFFFEAERHWDRCLKKANIEYFKASECEMLNGQFDPARLGMNLNSARALADATRRELCEVIEKVPLTGVAVSLVLDDFRDVIATNRKALYYYGSDSTILTYGRLIKSTIELIHQDQPELTKYYMAFTFDSHTDYLKAEAAYKELKEKDIFCSAMMGYIGHGDDKLIPALQMADLIASEARHKSREMLADSDRERPAFTFLSKAHAFYYIGVMAKNGLLSQLGDYPDPPDDWKPNKFNWLPESGV